MKRKTYVAIENNFAVIVSILIVSVIGLLKYKFNTITECNLGANYRDIYASLITFCSIVTALLATIKTIVVSIPENKGLKKLEKNKLSFNAFVNQLFYSILSNIILVIFCFTFLILEKSKLDFSPFCLAWIFLLTYSFLSFIWLEFLFFKLIKASR